MIATASLAREQRLVLEDRVELPRIYITWLSPAMFAADDAELDLVADLLANGKTSRLYRTLVYERRIALDVSAHQHSRELGSFFLLAATAAPGQSLAEIYAEIDAELDRRRRRWDRPTTKWSARSPRPRRSSCIACRPLADSAASPIS